ncbi:MAG: GNAT family N-acetyltransferase [Chloroflexi bacterium]|nr:GNAT family N-acetyltransferase [Chloroflexota bacterium]
MPTKTGTASRPAKPADPTAFKRAEGGIYRAVDGRFTIEPASGRWMVVDAEQQDDLGLPLARGPYDTLAAARAAAADARATPAPSSGLQARLASSPARTRAAAEPRNLPRGRRAPSARRESTQDARPPKPLVVELRRYAPGDGPAMRALWAEIGLASLGDDDDSLDQLAQRNPGLVILATEGDRLVGTALGAWDGRRGWIYHVGTAPDHRRTGLGRRLVHEVERKLRALGCPKVNVIVRDASPDAAEFWKALGYVSPPARQYGREL